MLRMLNQAMSFIEKKIGRRRMVARPWKLALEVASACNLRCITCRHHDERFGAVMAPAVFERVRPLLRWARTVNEVGYGEPLIDRKFLDKLAAVKRLGAAVYTYSNGTLLDAATAQRIVELGLDQITFSIDGATAETFESIRLGAKHHEVLANIRRLHECKLRMRRRRPTLRANFVGMRRNIAELPAAVDQLAEIGIQELVLSDLDASRPELVRESLGLMEEEARRYVTIAAERAKARRITFIAPPFFQRPLPFVHQPLLTAVSANERSGDDPSDASADCAMERDGAAAENHARPAQDSGAIAAHTSAARRLRVDGPHDARDGVSYAAQDDTAARAAEAADEGDRACGTPIDYTRFRCYEPWQTLFVTHDGQVRPCCAMSRSLGNLMDEELATIWNNAAYQQLRATVNSPQPAFAECRTCLLRKRVRLGTREAFRLGVQSLKVHGLRGATRRAIKYLSEYF